MRSYALILLAVLPLASADPKPLPKTLLSDARQRLLKGNYAEARAAFEKHIADPKYGPAAIIGIANAWRREGKYDDARKALDDGLKQFADNPDLLAARGDLNFDLGKWDEALADANAAMKKDADHFAARWVRVRLWRDSGKLDEADAEMRWFVRAYSAASNADKDITDPDTLLIIGQAGAENARWHNLTKQFSFIINDVYGDALKYDPDFWPAEHLIGAMLLEKYNRPDAVEAFDKVLSLNPKAGEAFIGKGMAALQKYEIKEAEEFATEALACNAKYPPALRFKADVHLSAGEFAFAEKALRDCLAVNPKDEAALGKLTALMYLQRKPAEADMLAQQAAAFDTKPGIFYQEMGEYLDDRKSYAKAEECFLKAAEFRPKLAAPRTSLGMLYLRMGREAEGRKLLDAAFAADKFNVRVANMRKVMEHLDRYETIKTPHYEVRFDGAKDRLLGEFVAEYLEEVHADLKKQYAYEPPGVVPFQIFSRHEMFSGRTVGLPDLHTIGACTGRVVAMASPKAQGVPRPFNWGRVIRHELVHIFNLTQTDQRCPHWLTEGLAVRNEQMKHPHLWTKALRDAWENETLFNLDNILIGFVKPKNQAQWTLAYCQSHLYVEYLIERHGAEMLPKLMKAFADGLDTDAAIRTVLGIEKPVFEAGYKVYLENWLKPFRLWSRGDDMTARMTLEQLEEAFGMDPNDLDVKSRLAEQYLRRNRPAEARKLADEVLEKDKGHAVATVVRARLLQQAGDNEAAVETLEKAVAASAKDSRLLLALGRAHIDAKNYDKASAALEKGRKFAPLDGDWLEQLARCYSSLEDSAKLIDVLTEITAHDPDELAARVKLGTKLLDTGDAMKALVIARQAAQIDVTNPEVQKLLVDCLAKSGGDAERMKRRFTEK